MNDNRLDVLRRWCQTHIDSKIDHLQPISSDAGLRRYFRIHAGGHNHVLMDAPPATEDIRPFIDIRRRLASAGVNVPEIRAADADLGAMLLTDLGDTSYLQALHTATAQTLFDDAVNALLDIQTRSEVAGLPPYDATLLGHELDLFVDWFVARHWQVTPTAAEQLRWNALCKVLIDSALTQSCVFVHRDFMPRNLMCTVPNPGIIDFQDAVTGPISYDPVCLYRDAFISWPTAQVDEWLETYRQRAATAGLPVPGAAAQWRRDCDLMGAQRHLKVIGIFARLCHRDGKPRYVEDTARFFGYLKVAIARNPELTDLGALLAAWSARCAQ